MDHNQTVISLKGPDRVRKRPAVVFGAEGLKGAVAVVKTLVGIFVTEAALGFSNRINVTIHKDNSISIRSFDRGFILDETVIDGIPSWYYDFCELSPGPREPDDNYYFSLGSRHNDLYEKIGKPIPKCQVDSDHCSDLCCVQYVSDFMHVEVTRDEIKKTLDFKKGYSISDLQKEPSYNPSNTYIHFKVDAEVFTDVNFQLSDFADFLRDAAITIPGLKCVLSDNKDGTGHTFLYPNGTEDYAAEISTSIPMTMFTNEMEATGRDRYNYQEYDAKVKIVFAFVKDAANVTCLHNHRKLECGGKHLDIVKEQLMHYINWEFIWDFKDESSPNDEDNYNSRRRFELSFDDIKENVVLILETSCTHCASMYINATKKAIKNRMITDMAHDLVSSDFEYYLKQNHDAIFSILKDIRHK